MSAFYDLASAVLVPSGYKSGKIYAQKPLTTDGQLTFTRASTATRVNASGLIETVSSGVPRLDYTNSSCPKLLLEPQRTNIALYSEQIDNAGWLKNNLSITANSAVSPDGYTNADLLDDGTASITQHWFYQGPAFANSTTYTISLYAKYVSRKCMAINIYNGASSQYVAYNIQDGTILGSTGDVTASITSVGNNWYRLVYTRTMAASGAPNFRIAMANDSGSESYTGSNKQTLIYGVQIEAGAYATSYVKTEAAAVTRLTDAAYKASISSLIGQTEGVAYIDFVWNGLTGIGSYPRIIELWGDSNNYIQLYSIAGTTSWGWDIYNGGVVQFTGSSTMTLGRNKIAIAYKLNDMAIYKNGALIASDTSCTVPATSSLGVAGAYAGSGAQLAASVSQFLLFKTRLTNAQLAELTTL
jgi:hypothetical protein